MYDVEKIEIHNNFPNRLPGLERVSRKGASRRTVITLRKCTFSVLFTYSAIRILAVHFLVKYGAFNNVLRDYKYL
jgi:hypothetical protein